MDKILDLMKQCISVYRDGDRFGLLRHIATVSGTFWIEDELPPDERMLHWPELELLSAFEFLRPELTPEEVVLLDGWIAKYAAWREQGIFFQRYNDMRPRFKYSWKDERQDCEKALGRQIPRSHWWFWPNEEEATTDNWGK